MRPTDGQCDDVLPAALPDVMAVSGINSASDQLRTNSNFSSVLFSPPSWGHRYSNYVVSPGNMIDVAAPAADILSTATNGGYETRSGTSMAAAYVSGLVALYIAANGRATNAEGVYRIRQAIIDHS